MRKACIAVSLLVLLGGGCVHDERALRTSHVLTSPDVEAGEQVLGAMECFVRCALDEDLSLQALRLKVDRVRKEYTIMPDTRDPEVRWAYRRGGEDKEYDVTVGLRVYPESPWSWSARRKQYRLMRQLADMEEEAWEYMTAYAVRREVEGLQVLREKTKHLDLALRLSEQVEEAAEAQHQAGQLTGEGAMNARLDVLKAETRFREAEASYRSALAGLALRLQRSPEDVEKDLPDLVAPEGSDVSLDTEALLATAKRGRLEVAALEMQWRLQRFEKALEIPHWLPWARHLQGSYRLGEEGDADLWIVSGAVSLPLSGITKGRSGQLKMLHEERELELQAFQRGLEAQVKKRAMYYEAAREQWSFFQADTEPMMQQLMQDLEGLDEDGSLAHSVVARQQKSLIDAMASRVVLLGRLLAAQTDLEEACGIKTW